jgi:hypothetical protein
LGRAQNVPELAGAVSKTGEKAHRGQVYPQRSEIAFFSERRRRNLCHRHYMSTGMI